MQAALPCSMIKGDSVDRRWLRARAEHARIGHLTDLNEADEDVESHITLKPGGLRDGLNKDGMGRAWKGADVGRSERKEAAAERGEAGRDGSDGVAL